MTMTHKEALQRAHDAYCRHETGGWDDDFIRAIRAYNEALDLVLLPKVSTGKMRSAQALAEASYTTDSNADAYSAMLAAAPDPFKDDAP